MLSANFILNRIPPKKASETPYELWKGRKPSYHYLKVWGCLAKVEVPKPKKVKIGPKTVDCVFIDMQTIVVHIGFWFINQRFQIYMLIQLLSQGMLLSLKIHFHITCV